MIRTLAVIILDIDGIASNPKDDVSIREPPIDPAAFAVMGPWLMSPIMAISRGMPRSRTLEGHFMAHFSEAPVGWLVLPCVGVALDVRARSRIRRRVLRYVRACLLKFANSWWDLLRQFGSVTQPTWPSLAQSRVPEYTRQVMMKCLSLVADTASCTNVMVSARLARELTNLVRILFSHSWSVGTE